MNQNSNEIKLTRKEREFLARKKDILEAATSLFAKNGYHGTTMSEIAKEAEFSTGSLYNFFKNKEELYFNLMLEKIDALTGEVNEIPSGEGSVEERLTLFIETILKYFENEKDFFKIFAEQRASFEMSAKGMFADDIHEKYMAYMAIMVNLMKEGVESGFFKPIEPGLLALSLVGILHSVLFISINIDQPDDLISKVPVVLDLFFHGTCKG
jgi:AcrR family transcriptional regulator